MILDIYRLLFFLKLILFFHNYLFFIKLNSKYTYQNISQERNTILKLVNLSENYVLYYTNNRTKKEIISKLGFNNEILLYINRNNFIFDKEI